LEKTRKHAMEMEKKEDKKTEERKKSKQGVIPFF
jgi:hypothetical protein